MEDNLVAADLLLKKGANPMSKNNRGTSVLMLMMKRTQLEMSDLCLNALSSGQRKEFVNLSTDPGWTALMTAAENCNYKSAEWLLKKGADVNTAMSTGWTAGHAASKKGNLEVLKLLLDSNANKHIQAVHRDFGKNLSFADVTVDSEVLSLLAKYP
jgi:ankyrin repeat protein